MTRWGVVQKPISFFLFGFSLGVFRAFLFLYVDVDVVWICVLVL